MPRPALLPLLLLAVARPTQAADPAALVRQLGDPAYATREAATRELERTGRAALPALRAGLADADLEVRRRCEALLRRVDRSKEQLRLDAFVREERDPRADPLPGWEALRPLAGGDRVARRLYADLAAAEPAFVEQLGRDPKAVGGQFQIRLRKLQQTFVFAGGAVRPREPATGPDLAALFLAAHFSPEPYATHEVVTLLNQPAYRQLTAGDAALARLLEGLLARPARDPDQLCQLAHLARALGLREFAEATLAPAARRDLDGALKQPVDLPRLYRAAASAAALGMGPEVVPRVEPVVRERIHAALAPSADVSRLHVTYHILLVLGMQHVIDRELKPAVGQLAREAGRGADARRVSLLASLCRSLDLPEALAALRPAGCRVLLDAAEEPEDAYRYFQAQSLAHLLDLKAAAEAVLQPAMRRRVVDALADADDWDQLRSLTREAGAAGLRDLMTDTLEPALARRAREALAGPKDPREIQKIYLTLDRLGMGAAVRDAVAPAVRECVRTCGTRPADPDALPALFYLAEALEVKEVADLAVRVALERGPNPYLRGQAVQLVAVWGTVGQVRRLEPLLGDAVVLGHFFDGEAMHEARVQDAVLAALVEKTGQSLREYGFRNSGQAGVPRRMRPTAAPPLFGFSSDSARQAALRKWKAWSAANQAR